MHVCVVSPIPPAKNPRAVKEVEALVHAGHEVTYIFGVHHDWANEHTGVTLPPGCRAIAIPYGPATPLRRRIPQLLRRFASRTMLRWRPGSAKWAGRLHNDATWALARYASHTNAELFIGHLPGGLSAAAIAAQKNLSALAFDAEDFHPGELVDGPSQKFKGRLVECIESQHLPDCAFVTAASPGIGAAYSVKYGIPTPAVILNVFPIAQAADHPTPSGVATPGPSVYWFSLSIGPHRGLECATKAISIAKSKPHLYLRGVASRDYSERLNAIAAEFGASDRIHFLPPGRPSTMERLAATYDLGLVSETGVTENRQICLTNKQFSFLLAGVPVVMSNTSAHTNIARSLGEAVRLYEVENPSSLAASIDHYLLDVNRLAKAREAAFTLGQTKYNWELERSKFLRLVSDIQNKGE